MTTRDLAKRRRIMQRSIQLGHCICDPKRPCPCDVLKTQDICPCAGERPETITADKVKLTQLVHNPGCASKIPAADLERTLNRLSQPDNPRVLSGIASGDDAGIYLLNDDTTIVQTVDVFTPCVDDPETFGKICAANCLSDIYAMGGVPHTALSVLCFPIETLDGQIMYSMMKGAMEVFTEAGVSVIGGHSVKDEEIKLGFAITGTVDRHRAIEHNNAQVGDILVLTKKLGTGVLNFARQINKADPQGLEEAEKSMMTLNRAAAEALAQHTVSSGTDVTGFGLYGHLVSMARTSGVTAHVWADRLPVFPGVVEAFAQNIIPGACERNREFVADDIRISDNVPAELAEIGFDAQTSGGLLLAVPPQELEALQTSFQSHNVPCWVIGRITEASRGLIAVTMADEDMEQAGNFADHDEELPQHAVATTQQNEAPCCAEFFEPKKTETACCAEFFEQKKETSSTVQTTAADSLRAFGGLMRSVSAEGAIDEKTKEMIMLALTAVTRCEPCLKAHLKNAAEMGITPEQIEEILWSAIAMGGAPVRMFCQDIKKQLSENSGNSCC